METTLGRSGKTQRLRRFGRAESTRAIKNWPFKPSVKPNAFLKNQPRHHDNDQPRHHDNERLLDRLVEVLERPSLLVAVDRLRRMQPP
jgi:hypothetical protein